MTPIEFHTGQIPRIKQTPKGEELHVYDCPFCDGGEEHLFFFPSNTAWDCKKCGRKGNVHVFNQEFYNECCTRNLDAILALWKLPRRVFEKIKYNPYLDCPVLPTFRNTKLNNLYKVVRGEKQDKETGEWRATVNVMGTPGLGSTLFDWSDDAHDTIWLCEGQKDKLAGDAIIGISHDVTPVGVPGSSSFRDSWIGAFHGKEVVLLFDNDESGRKGVEKVIAAFHKGALKPKKISKVDWPEDKATGYDLYDLYQEYKGSSWAELNKIIVEVQDEEATKVSSETVLSNPECNSHALALTSFEDAYHVTPDMRAALALALASIYSVNIQGEQVWIKLLGPPGSGKSSIAKAISASDYVVNMSTFTGLFSGWQDGDEKDPGLVPLISGRTLVVKDADALLRQPNIERIMSELRDFYDKDSSVSYKNRRRYDYQGIRSTFIMMGTQALRRSDQSFLGERLLTIELNVSKADTEAMTKKAMQVNLRKALDPGYDPETTIMADMKGWVDDHLRLETLDSTVPPPFQERIMELCSFTANMRTQVDRDPRGRLMSPAVVEVPTRLIGQLLSATLGLSMVFQVNKPNDEVEHILAKVAKDTVNPRSHRVKICDYIIENPGITAGEIGEQTGLHKETIGRELSDLLELNFVDIRMVTTQPGYKAKGFIMKPHILNPYREIMG